MKPLSSQVSWRLGKGPAIISNWLFASDPPKSLSNVPQTWGSTISIGLVALGILLPAEIARVAW
jgi:hypothetical protein